MSNNHNENTLSDKGLSSVEFEYVDVAFGGHRTETRLLNEAT